MSPRQNSESPVADGLGTRASSAFVWQGLQHFGVKAIYVIRIPILARLLAPDDFGLMAIAFVAVGAMMQFTDFGLVPALVQRADTDERHYHAAWSIGLLRALVVTATVFAAAPLVAGFFSEPRAAGIIRLLAFRPMLQAVASIRTADLTRNLEFRGLAVLNLTDAVTNAVVSIALAPLIGVWALVAGALASPTVYAALSYVIAPYRPALAIQRSATGSLVRFGRWVFITGVVAFLGNAALQAVISRRLGTVELGLYFLATRIAFLPSEVSSELVGGVAFPLYSRLQSDSDRAQRTFRGILIGMAVVLLPIVGLLIALAPVLVDGLLGPRWQGTAPVIQVLAAASGLSLFANAAVPIFKGIGQPWRMAALRTVQSVVLVALAWDFAGRFGVVGAAAAWMPATVAALVIAVAMMVRRFPGVLRGLPFLLLLILLTSSAGAAAAYGVAHVTQGAAGFFLGGVVGGGLAAVTLWNLDRRFDLGIRSVTAQLTPLSRGLRNRLGGGDGAN
jgi:O-antigen/teichoic acid export membrane protein